MKKGTFIEYWALYPKQHNANETRFFYKKEISRIVEILKGKQFTYGIKPIGEMNCIGFVGKESIIRIVPKKEALVHLL